MEPFTLSRDVDAFNAIANDPAVHPFVARKGQAYLDFAAFFNDDRNIGFLGNDCAFVAHYLEPGCYEVHSMALPGARGRTVWQTAMAAIRHMFIATPAMDLLTRVAGGNVAAAALAAKVGFVLEFERKGGWEGPDGAKDCRFYAMRYPDWVKRQDWLMASGEWFHHECEKEDLSHPEDPAHNRYVGACVEMVRAGQARKGVILYNRWARFADYPGCEIVSDEPLIIDAISHLIRVEDGNIRIIA